MVFMVEISINYDMDKLDTLDSCFIIWSRTKFENLVDDYAFCFDLYTFDIHNYLTTNYFCCKNFYKL